MEESNIEPENVVQTASDAAADRKNLNLTLFIL